MLPRRSIAPRVVVACSLALTAGCSPSKDATVSQPPPAAPVSLAPVAAAPSTPIDDAARIASDLPPLPPGLDMAARTPEVVRAVYLFAARHPEVLRYVPCFCGCERMGHQGNDQCFVATRNASGAVTAWEPHGMICAVCLDVGGDAMRMHNSGASTVVIRDFIEKKYAKLGSLHTPTPLPPRGGGIQPH